MFHVKTYTKERTMATTLTKRKCRLEDAAISIKKLPSAARPAVIDRLLVELLLAIDREGSVSLACRQLNCSTRHAQRMLKRFSEGSGIELLEHHGSKGTTLSDEARQCIAFYMAFCKHAEWLLGEYPIAQAIPTEAKFKAKEKQQDSKAVSHPDKQKGAPER